VRITVFGATGRTGRYILAEGPRRDHQLTAFTRWPAALVGPSTLAAVAWTTAATRYSPQGNRRCRRGDLHRSAERRKGSNHVAEVSR
jgi:hypothetical protein